jgi:hypothetical protein
MCKRKHQRTPQLDESRSFTGVGSLDLLEPRLGRVHAAGGAPRAGALVGVPFLPKNRGTGVSKRGAGPSRAGRRNRAAEQGKQSNGQLGHGPWRACGRRCAARRRSSRWPRPAPRTGSASRRSCRRRRPSRPDEVEAEIHQPTSSYARVRLCRELELLPVSARVRLRSALPRRMRATYSRAAAPGSAPRDRALHLHQESGSPQRQQARARRPTCRWHLRYFLRRAAARAPRRRRPAPAARGVAVASTSA